MIFCTQNLSQKIGSVSNRFSRYKSESIFWSQKYTFFLFQRFQNFNIFCFNGFRIWSYCNHTFTFQEEMKFQSQNQLIFWNKNCADFMAPKTVSCFNVTTVARPFPGGQCRIQEHRDWRGALSAGARGRHTTWGHHFP